jgi:hypothetical protein
MMSGGTQIRAGVRHTDQLIIDAGNAAERAIPPPLPTPSGGSDGTNPHGGPGSHVPGTGSEAAAAAAPSPPTPAVDQRSGGGARHPPCVHTPLLRSRRTACAYRSLVVTYGMPLN